MYGFLENDACNGAFIVIIWVYTLMLRDERVWWILENLCKYNNSMSSNEKKIVRSVFVCVWGGGGGGVPCYRIVGNYNQQSQNIRLVYSMG